MICIAESSLNHLGSLGVCQFMDAPSSASHDSYNTHAPLGEQLDRIAVLRLMVVKLQLLNQRASTIPPIRIHILIRSYALVAESSSKAVRQIWPGRPLAHWLGPQRPSSRFPSWLC